MKRKENILSIALIVIVICMILMFLSQAITSIENKMILSFFTLLSCVVLVLAIIMIIKKKTFMTLLITAILGIITGTCWGIAFNEMKIKFFFYSLPPLIAFILNLARNEKMEFKE